MTRAIAKVTERLCDFFYVKLPMSKGELDLALRAEKNPWVV